MNTVTVMLVIVLLILLFGIFILLIKIFSMNEKLKKLKNTNQKVITLSVLQDFMNIIGDNLISSEEKINKINEILIEKYEIKYSTIVIFNGIKFKVEASNVNQKHWRSLENLQSQDIFLESMNNATPKYITVSEGEKLPYLDMEYERAKSAIFFPMYIDNVCIGYWLIEGSKTHEFDNIDTTILGVIKNNLLSAIKNLRNQKVLENISRKDNITGLNTYEYLYGEARKTIDKYPTSVVSLIKITNLLQIGEKVSIKTLNLVMKKITEYIQENLSPEYYCVKFSEDELAVIFSGSDIDGVEKFLANMKDGIEKLRIKTIGSLKESMNGLAVAPKLNIALTTYYKETALEQVLNSLYIFLQQADSTDSNISCL